jgi:DNA primase
MSVTDEIKARLDIVSYINQYVPLKKAGKYHKACCPFHGEKTPSFVVNDDRQSWRCFGACAEGGDIFNFAMKYHGWDFKEALVELGKQAGVEVEQRTPEQKQRAERGDYLRGMLNEVAHAYHTKLYDPDDPAAVDALRYAREGRGLSDETIKAFGIGYAPAGWQNVLDHLIELGYSQDDVIEAGLALRNDRGKVYDRFRNRFMVPIRDQRGRVVGFGGRVLDPEDSPKYMNSPQTPVFDKSRLLFGLDLAKQSIRESETAVIVEGYMDAITAHQAGFTNVVAQMGTAMTETQLRLIAPKHAKTVVLALDSDAAGQNATRRSLEVAREALASDFTGKLSIDMRVLQIPDAKDPDDLIRENPDRWRELVAHATPVVDFVIDMELAGLSDEPTVQQRESVARSLMPILTATENNLYQRENVQKLALRLLLPERELMRIAEEVRKDEDRLRRQRQKRQQQQQQQAAPDEGPPPVIIGDAVPDFGPDDGPPPLDFDAAPAPRRQRQPMSADTRLETHLLHRLIQKADVYYEVNGRLREVAGGDELLIKTAMAPLSPADFSHTGLRALMDLFVQALGQDDMDIEDYILAHADGVLHDELHAVLSNQFDSKLNDTSAVAPGDRDRILEKIQRSGVVMDPIRDMIAQAFRLRCRRLMREREELRLVQANAISSGDADQSEQCAAQLDLLARAVHRLEIEEKQVARLY